MLGLFNRAVHLTANRHGTLFPHTREPSQPVPCKRLVAEDHHLAGQRASPQMRQDMPQAIGVPPERIGGMLRDELLINKLQDLRPRALRETRARVSRPILSGRERIPRLRSRAHPALLTSPIGHRHVTLARNAIARRHAHERLAEPNPAARLARMSLRQSTTGSVIREGCAWLWRTTCVATTAAAGPSCPGMPPVLRLRSHCGKSELDTSTRSRWPALIRHPTGPRRIWYSTISPGFTGVGSLAELR